MDAPLGRRRLAEGVGTGILVLFGAGSVVAALTLGGGELDYAGLGMIAIAFGLAIALAIYAFGETSGAHINPAVTISLATAGRFPWPEVPHYVAAQAVGATVGAALIVAAFGGPAVDLGTGATTFADGTGYFQGIVAEAIGTYLLVLAIMALAVDKRAPAGWAGFMIGLAVVAAILLIGPLTGASINPARTLGPLLVNTFGGGDTAWGDLPGYLIGTIAGGIVAALSYDAIARPRLYDESEPPQGAAGDIEGRATGRFAGGETTKEEVTHG
jgi:glycerol uptake facilitator protein